MILTHSLPPDTRDRVRRSLRVLEQFPLIGRQLEGRWRPLRFTLGPWRWMLILYSCEEPDDVILVVASRTGGRPLPPQLREVPRPGDRKDPPPRDAARPGQWF